MDNPIWCVIKAYLVTMLCIIIVVFAFALSFGVTMIVFRANTIETIMQGCVVEKKEYSTGHGNVYVLNIEGVYDLPLAHIPMRGVRRVEVTKKTFDTYEVGEPYDIE